MTDSLPQQFDEPTLDVLGRLVDTAENFAIYGDSNGAFGRLDPFMRIEALTHGIEEMVATIKKLYFDGGGEDVWP